MKIALLIHFLPARPLSKGSPIMDDFTNEDRNLPGEESTAITNRRSAALKLEIIE